MNDINMSQVFSGRPSVPREEPEERCYELLDSLGIEYRRADHDEAADMQALEPVERLLGGPVCKNLFLTNRQQTDFYLLLMPGSKPFKTKYLSAQLGCSRLSFASGEQLFQLLGVHPGSASILALQNDPDGRVRLVIDDDLRKDRLFGCHPCRNTSTLMMSMDDVQSRLIPALHHEPSYVSLPWEVE